jgi:hypothetical protein
MCHDVMGLGEKGKREREREKEKKKREDQARNVTFKEQLQDTLVPI